MTDLIEQGKKAGRRKDWPEAESLFRSAYKQANQAAQPSRIAEAALYLGHAILNQNDPARYPEACAMLGEARDRMLAGGATEDAQRVEQMLDRAGCLEASSKRRSLDDVILGFIDTMSIDHACDYLIIHPEMLTPKGERKLERLKPSTQRISGLPVTPDLITFHLQLLRECRRSSVEEIRARRAGPMRGLPDRHIEAIYSNTRDVLTTMPERKAEWRQTLGNLVEDAVRQNDPDSAAFIRAVIDILDNGLDNAESRTPSIPTVYENIWKGLLAYLGS